MIELGPQRNIGTRRMAAIPYPNQRCLIVIEPFMAVVFESKYNAFIQGENASKTFASKMSAILFRPKCVEA